MLLCGCVCVLGLKCVSTWVYLCMLLLGSVCHWGELSLEGHYLIDSCSVRLLAPQIDGQMSYGSPHHCYQIVCVCVCERRTEFKCVCECVCEQEKKRV